MKKLAIETENSGAESEIENYKVHEIMCIYFSRLRERVSDIFHLHIKNSIFFYSDCLHFGVTSS